MYLASEYASLFCFFFKLFFNSTGDGKLYTDDKLVDTGQCHENLVTLSLLGTPHCMDGRSETFHVFSHASYQSKITRKCLRA